MADPIDLRARAQEIGVSVATLSETLGFTPSDVTDLFRGHKVPTDDQVDVLARVLDVDPHRFSQAPSIPEDIAQVPCL
ncbi:MAG: helix-turn-helix domain-containing protein [Acidimicrobiales bacterium]